MSEPVQRVADSMEEKKENEELQAAALPGNLTRIESLVVSRRKQENEERYARAEVLHLISQYLKWHTPCSNAAEALRKDVVLHGILPPIESWNGVTRPGTLEDLSWRFGSLQHDSSVIKSVMSALHEEHVNDEKRREQLSVLGKALTELRGKIRHNKRTIKLLEKAEVSDKRRIFFLEKGVERMQNEAAAYRNQVVKLQHFSTSRSPGAAQRPKVSGSSLFRDLKFLKKTQGHFLFVFCVCVDPAGEFVVTGSDDQLIKVWSAHSGALLRTLRGHKHNVCDLQIKRTAGRRTILASASDDRSIRIWEIPSGRAVCVLLGHTKGIEAIRFDIHTGLLYSASNDGACCIWDTDAIYRSADRGEVTSAQDKRPTLLPHVSHKLAAAVEVNCVAVHPAGGLIATGDGAGTVRIWVGSRTLDPRVEARCQTALISATPLVNGLYTNGSKRLLHIIHTQFSQISSISWSNSGYRLLANSSVDGSARAWEWKHTCRNDDVPFSFGSIMENGSSMFTLSTKAPEPAQSRMTRSLASPKEPRTASLGGTSTPTRSPSGGRTTQSAKSKKGSAASRNPPTLDACAWSCDDRWVITSQSVPPPATQARNVRAFWDQQVRVWDANNQGNLVHVFRKHRGQAMVVAPHPSDPGICLTAGWDGMILIWDILKGELVSQNLAVHSNGIVHVLDAAFLPFAKTGADVVCSDSMGRVNFLGTRSGAEYTATPPAQFFANDRATLLHDQHGNAVDSQSQLPPHLCPPMPLCDATMVPYELQPKVTSAVDRARAVKTLEAVLRERETAALNEFQPVLDYHDNMILSRSNGSEVPVSPIGPTDTEERPRTVYRDDIEEAEEARRLQASRNNSNSEPGQNVSGSGVHTIRDLQSINTHRTSTQGTSVSNASSSADRRQSNRGSRGGKGPRVSTSPVNRSQNGTLANLNTDDDDADDNYVVEDDVLEGDAEMTEQISPQEIRDLHNLRTIASASPASAPTDGEGSSAPASKRRAAQQAQSRIQTVSDYINDTSIAIKETPAAASSAAPAAGSIYDLPLDAGDLVHEVGNRWRALCNKIDRDWLYEDSEVPQLGDFVVYSVQAHQIDVERLYKQRCAGFPRQLVAAPPIYTPWEDPAFTNWPFVVGQIKHTKYFFPYEKKALRVELPNGHDGIFMSEYMAKNEAIVIEYTLQVDSAPPPDNPLPRTNQWTKVSPQAPLFITVTLFKPPDGAPPIFLSRERFNSISLSNLRPNMEVKNIQGKLGSIESIGPVDPVKFPTSPFHAVSVKWQDGQTSRHSPWELKPVEIQLVPWDVKPPSLESSMALNIADALADLATQNQNSAPFREPVSMELYPEYRMVVAMPADLMSISRKLKAGFYRSLNQVFADLALIKNNCKTFNPQSAPIRKLANVCIRLANQAVIANIPITHIPPQYNRDRHELGRFPIPRTKTPTLKINKAKCSGPEIVAKSNLNRVALPPPTAQPTRRRGTRSSVVKAKLDQDDAANFSGDEYQLSDEDAYRFDDEENIREGRKRKRPTPRSRSKAKKKGKQTRGSQSAQAKPVPNLTQMQTPLQLQHSIQRQVPPEMHLHTATGSQNLGLHSGFSQAQDLAARSQLSVMQQLEHHNLMQAQYQAQMQQQQSFPGEQARLVDNRKQAIMRQQDQQQMHQQQMHQQQMQQQLQQQIQQQQQQLQQQHQQQRSKTADSNTPPSGSSQKPKKSTKPPAPEKPQTPKTTKPTVSRGMDPQQHQQAVMQEQQQQQYQMHLLQQQQHQQQQQFQQQQMLQQQQQLHASATDPRGTQQQMHQQLQQHHNSHQQPQQSVQQQHQQGSQQQQPPHYQQQQNMHQPTSEHLRLLAPEHDPSLSFSNANYVPGMMTDDARTTAPGQGLPPQQAPPNDQFQDLGFRNAMFFGGMEQTPDDFRDWNSNGNFMGPSAPQQPYEGSG